MAGAAVPAQSLIGHGDAVQCLYRVPDPDLILISGDINGTICIWDPTRSSRPVQKIQVGSEPVNSIVCVDDHHLYAAAGCDLQRFDRRRLGGPVELLHSADDEINQISLLDRRLAWCDDTGSITSSSIGPDSTLDIDLYIESAHDNICTSILMYAGDDGDGPLIYTAGMDSKIRIWDLQGDLIECLDTNMTSSVSSNVIQSYMIHNLSYSNDGCILSAGLQSSHILLIDTNTYSIARLHSHTSIVTNVHFPAFRPRDTLISASSDSTLVVWNLDPESVLDSDRLQDFSQAEISLFDVNLIQARIRLPYKPNDITTSVEGDVYIGDTSPDIHVYHLL